MPKERKRKHSMLLRNREPETVPRKSQPTKVFETKQDTGKRKESPFVDKVIKPAALPDTNCEDEVIKTKQIALLKSNFKITPKTCYQLWDIGLRSVSDFQDPELTAQILYDRFNLYGRRNNLWKGSDAPRNYLTVFRRLLWTANASEEEKLRHPHMMTCKAWSIKAMVARGEFIG